ncbi:MAG: hypothetical protein NC205_08220 [Prevotella sp.]|nr:hypothetical protein [Alistipes senegalensis]MCM1358568.1 hypothetical protein [Prevotella sp.]
MNKKSKKTLKNAFNIPEPKRKEEFFSSLETKQKKSFSFNIPLYISTAVTAVVIMGIWGGVKNLPHFQQPENIDTPVYSESTSLPHHTENTEKPTVQTTVVFSTEKNTTVNSSVSTVRTSGISTVSGTEPTKNTVSVQTTIKTETAQTETTTTTIKENNNISHKPTTEIYTTEITSAPETEFLETTTTKITTVTTAPRITTKTTVKITTTTTKIFHEITTTSTDEEPNVPDITKTTSREGELNVAVTTKTYMNSGVPSSVPQTTTSLDFNIHPMATTTTEDTTGACAEPQWDFTVVPPVRYYPDGEIYITDSVSNNVIPSAPSSVNEIFREMAENSDLIVVVEVDEIIYTGFDGKPYTQENAVIKDVIYGDIPVNSRISIYCKGGYIPANECSSDIEIGNTTENNVTVLDYAGNNNFSQEGDVYMCFLKKSYGDFPDGSYYLTGLNNISKFTCSGDDFINYNNHNSITSGEIQSFFNQ